MVRTNRCDEYASTLSAVITLMLSNTSIIVSTRVVMFMRRCRSARSSVAVSNCPWGVRATTAGESGTSNVGSRVDHARLAFSFTRATCSAMAARSVALIVACAKHKFVVTTLNRRPVAIEIIQRMPLAPLTVT